VTAGLERNIGSQVFATQDFTSRKGPVLRVREITEDGTNTMVYGPLKAGSAC
jgi:hypothetical protein